MIGHNYDDDIYAALNLCKPAGKQAGAPQPAAAPDSIRISQRKGNEICILRQ